MQTQSLHHQDRVNADISAEAASVQNAVSEVCSATAFLELVDREIVCVQSQVLCWLEGRLVVHLLIPDRHLHDP